MFFHDGICGTDNVGAHCLENQVMRSIRECFDAALSMHRKKRNSVSASMCNFWLCIVHVQICVNRPLNVGSQRMCATGVDWSGFFLLWSRVDFFHGAHGAQLRSLANTRVDSFYSGAAWIFPTRRLCFSVLQGASETRRCLRAPEFKSSSVLAGARAL